MLTIKRTATIAIISGACLWCSYGLGHFIGSKDERLAQQEVIQNEYIRKSTAEIQLHNATQAALDAVAKKHSEEMAELEGSTDGIIDALDADNKRMRIKLKTIHPASGDKQQCITTANGAAEIDAGDAKRLISIAQKGDKWIQSLQETIRVLQAKEGTVNE